MLYLKDVIEDLINSRYFWKIYLKLGLIFQHYKNDGVEEKGTYIYHIHETIMLSTNIDEVLRRFFIFY